jgi:hypothetical protein
MKTFWGMIVPLAIVGATLWVASHNQKPYSPRPSTTLLLKDDYTSRCENHLVDLGATVDW